MPTLDEALAEAYTLSPSGQTILNTIELRHPTFIVDGVLTALRIVNQYGIEIDSDPDMTGWLLTLEDDAPLNAGEAVWFYSSAFSLAMPDQSDAIPTLNIIMDNIVSELSPHLDAALGVRSPIELTYREYLSDSPTVVRYIMGGMTLGAVNNTVTRSTGSAGYFDLLNKTFPGSIYRPSTFKALRP